MDSQECLDCALAGENACGFDYALLKTLYKNNDWGASKVQNIGVTTLTQCLRGAFFDKKNPVPRTPSSYFIVTCGTLYHAGIEEAVEGDDNVKAEGWLSWPKMGYKTTWGRYDLKYEDRLVDIKTKRKLDLRYLPSEDHVVQTNVYWWMMPEAERSKIKKLQIQYIDVNGPSQCSKCKTFVKFIDGEIKCGICGRKPRNGHLGAILVDVPFMKEEEILEYLEVRRTIYTEAVKAGELPPAEPSFLCRFKNCVGLCLPGLKTLKTL